MTWDEIYERADGTGFGDPELRAKDIARCEVRELVFRKEGYDIETAEIPEDEVDYYCGLHNIRFYENGIIDSYTWE